jgi:hypothetical protein
MAYTKQNEEEIKLRRVEFDTQLEQWFNEVTVSDFLLRSCCHFIFAFVRQLINPRNDVLGYSRYLARW